MINTEEIINLIKTKQEALVFERELDVLIASIYQSPGFEETLKSRVRESTALIVKEAVSDKSREKVLKDLKSRVKKLETIVLTLAFEPNEKMIGKFASWVTSNVGSEKVLDIGVKNHLVGGATISYKGKYGDYSLSKTFNERFENKRQELSKLMVGD